MGERLHISALGERQLHVGVTRNVLRREGPRHRGEGRPSEPGGLEHDPGGTDRRVEPGRQLRRDCPRNTRCAGDVQLTDARRARECRLERAQRGLRIRARDVSASPAAICNTFVLSSEPVMFSTVPVPAILIFLALVRLSPAGRTKVPPACAVIFPELVTLLPKTNSVEV